MNQSTLRRAILAAACITAVLPGLCHAASEVVIPLSGAVIQSGSSIVLSATTPIDHADIYYYEISGTCHGTGRLMPYIGGGTNFTTALQIVDAGLVPYLNGTVLDVKNTFPFTCVNKTATGTLKSLHLKGTIHVKAGIDKNGLCTCSLTAISFRLGPFLDKADTLVIDDGQCLVQVSPIAGDAQPDLMFREPGGKIFGRGKFGTTGAGQAEEVNLLPGQHFTNIVVLQNYSAATDSYTLSTVGPGTGYKQKFIYGGKDITTAVAAGTFVIPKVKPGATKTLSWEMINVNASSNSDNLNNSVLPRLTATSVNDSSKVDALGYFSIP